VSSAASLPANVAATSSATPATRLDSASRDLVVAAQVEIEINSLEAVQHVLALRAETRRGQAGVDLGSIWGHSAPPYLVSSWLTRVSGAARVGGAGGGAGGSRRPAIAGGRPPPEPPCTAPST